MMEKTLFRLGVFAAAAVLIAIMWPAFAGETYTADDLTQYHLPMRAFYAKCLAAGDNFTWMPGLFCGYYLHGDGQVGMYHPLHVALYRVLPFMTAFNLEILSGYIFALFGMYLFLRRWQVRRDAALFGAITFAFSGFNLLHLMHMNAVAVVSHIPWLLFCLDVLARGAGRKSRALGAMGVAALTGSQILLGYPQYVWFSVMAETLYVVLVFAKRSNRRVIPEAIAAKVIGVGLGAVQLAATIDLFQHSVRGATAFQYRFVDSLRWVDLVQFAAPYLMHNRVSGDNTHELGIYLGAAAPVLMVWLVLSWKTLGDKKRLAWGAMIFAVTAFVMALGDSGLLSLFLARMPVVGLFRAPARHIALVHLALAVAVALAFERAAQSAESPAKQPWTRLGWLGIIPAASLVILVVSGWPQDNLENWAVPVKYAPGNGWAVPAGVALVTAASALVVAALRGRRAGLAVLVLFAAADQAVYGLSYVRQWPVGTIETAIDTEPSPPEAYGYRVASQTTYSDVWTLEGYRLVYGYAGVVPERKLDYEGRNELRVAGAMWRQGVSGDETGEGDGLLWVEAGDPLARARLVSKWVVRSGEQTRLYDIDVSSTAVLEEEVDVGESGPGGAVNLIEDTPGRIRLATQAPAKQILVVSESYHEGWRVTVDGESRAVLRVYHDFFGCVVEGGEHEVVFEFSPLSLRAGGILSVISLGLTALLGAFAGGGRKRDASGMSQA